MDDWFLDSAHDWFNTKALNIEGFFMSNETSGLVASLTDEMVAELERKASRKADEGFILVHNLECAAILALLAERAELKRDAKRYRFIRDNQTDPRFMAKIEAAEKWFSEYMLCDAELDAAMDDAMEHSK